MAQVPLDDLVDFNMWDGVVGASATSIREVLVHHFGYTGGKDFDEMRTFVVASVSIGYFHPLVRPAKADQIDRTGHFRGFPNDDSTFGCGGLFTFLAAIADPPETDLDPDVPATTETAYQTISSDVKVTNSRVGAITVVETHTYGSVDPAQLFVSLKLNATILNSNFAYFYSPPGSLYLSSKLVIGSKVIVKTIVSGNISGDATLLWSNTGSSGTLLNTTPSSTSITYNGGDSTTLFTLEFTVTAVNATTDYVIKGILDINEI